MSYSDDAIGFHNYAEGRGGDIHLTPGKIYPKTGRHDATRKLRTARNDAKATETITRAENDLPPLNV
jgi:hypothetical protein